jgi:GMP synthase-like glutamine amidotransferase
MKPVAIFTNVAHEGPGFLATFLNENAIASVLFDTSDMARLPTRIADYSGLVLMGGPMSVNDELPWIDPVLTLIKQAMAMDLPVLGHCLGGQLMAKACGAWVSKNTQKEIGWAAVTVPDNPVAKRWLADIEKFYGFHWHGETFDLPAGATLLLSSEHCQHQAYAMGKHLALQCHIEMTPDMIKNWCEEGRQELLDAFASPAVQQADDMQINLPLRYFFLQKVARQLYGQWIKGLL